MSFRWSKYTSHLHIHQSVSQSASQSISQSINQSVNQSVCLWVHLPTPFFVADRVCSATDPIWDQGSTATLLELFHWTHSFFHTQHCVTCTHTLAELLIGVTYSEQETAHLNHMSYGDSFRCHLMVLDTTTSLNFSVYSRELETPYLCIMNKY
jgi:hypothetical protein